MNDRVHPHVDVRTHSFESPTGGVPAPLVRTRSTVADALVRSLEAMGLRHAFGVIGGSVAPLYDALRRSRVEWLACRHESGAAFAAVEASLATGAPVLVYVTTGPGLTNALTGAMSAWWEGAKLILVSGYTPAAKRGRCGRESGLHTLPHGLYTASAPFDHVTSLEDPAQLPGLVRALARGFSSPRGFVAHVAIPASVQVAPAPISLAATTAYGDLVPAAETMDTVVERLRRPFAVWVGFGCRYAAPELRALVLHTGAPVMATPRGKGSFPEDHPAYLGVTGVGGHGDLGRRLRDSRVETLLVLGTRLGELSSFHDPELVPPGGLVHVDLDDEVPGSAYPEVDTLAVRAEIGGLLRCLLARCDELERRPGPSAARPRPVRLEPRADGRIRPQYLMQHMQGRIVEGSDAVVLSESGSSFLWTNYYLRFAEPLRYRISGLFCPMGHVSAGALGTAMGSGKRAVAVVGDGALLMQNELSTAAQIRANTAWIVLNDARYGIITQGLSGQGYARVDFGLPEVDFAELARALGVEGVRVEREDQLDEALARLSSSRLPFLLDVLVDPDELAPLSGKVYGMHEPRAGEP
jgi:acetolactate synthase-1/2/3 large subunit